jgi:hypothetical protein
MKSRSFRLGLMAGAAGAALIVAPAFAQQAGDASGTAPVAADDQAQMSDDIVVTAQFR